MGCFPLCQTDRSEISGNTRGKWNDIFQLNRAGQPIEMALVILNSFPNSLIRAKNRFVINGTANFGRNGPPAEVIPNIPVRRNRNELFHLNSNRNVRNLWHDGKHPWCHISKKKTVNQGSKPRVWLPSFWMRIIFRTDPQNSISYSPPFCHVLLQGLPSASEDESLYSSYIVGCVLNAFLTYTAIMLNIAVKKTSYLLQPLRLLLLNFAVSDLGRLVCCASLYSLHCLWN